MEQKLLFYKNKGGLFKAKKINKITSFPYKITSFPSIPKSGRRNKTLFSLPINWKFHQKENQSAYFFNNTNFIIVFCCCCFSLILGWTLQIVSRENAQFFVAMSFTGNPMRQLKLQYSVMLLMFFCISWHLIWFFYSLLRCSGAINGFSISKVSFLFLFISLASIELFSFFVFCCQRSNRIN